MYAFTAIPEEMGTALKRTTYSLDIKGVVFSNHNQ